MKKTIILFFWFCFFYETNLLFAQNSLGKLTLEQAVSMATHNQPLLREAQDYVKVAAGQVQQAESAKYPQIAAVLNYHYLSPVPSITMPFGTGGSFDLAPAHNYNASVNIRYLIFDFDRRNEMIRLLQSHQLSEQQKINLLKNRLAYSTVQAFYSILFLQKSLKVKDEQLHDLEQHLVMAKKLVETGSAISLDTLTTRVRITALLNQKISIANILHQNEIVLKSLLNVKKDTVLNLTGDFLQTVQPYSLDSLIQTAYEHREEIKLIKIGQQAAKIREKLAHISAMPTLSAVASVGLKNGYPEALYRIRGNYVVGMAADFPIFEGHLKKAKIATAAWNTHALQNHLEAVKKTISREVQQAEANLITSQKQLKTARIEIKSAEAAVQQARIQYKSGYATNLALLDAETSLTRARLTYIAGLYKITLNKYKLLETMGIRIW